MKRLLALACLPVCGLLMLTGCDAAGLDAATGSTATIDRYQCPPPPGPDCGVNGEDICNPGREEWQDCKN